MTGRSTHTFGASSGSGSSYLFGGSGGNVIKDLKVFKAGTFKDSQGRQKTWTTKDLADLVKNFNTLKSSGAFPKVPVRVDHTESARDVVGWIAGLRSDADFLYADIEFTEPDAYEKYERGSYGPRSSEIGEYETNGEDPKTYFPVFMGLAFVDLPAVEGLHGSAKSTVMFQQVILEGDETQMKFKINGTETEDAAAVQAHIDAVAPLAAKGATKFKVGGVEVEDFAAVQTAIDAAEAKITEFAKTGTHTFKVAGADISDFAAVQAHVDTLEKFAEETRVSNRKTFVTGLAAASKITAPQVESLSELAVGMTDEQFEKFSASYDAAPVLSLFGQHAGGVTNPANAGANATVEGAVKTQEDILVMLRKSGMPKELVEKSAAFARLAELKSGASR